MQPSVRQSSYSGDSGYLLNFKDRARGREFISGYGQHFSLGNEGFCQANELFKRTYNVKSVPDIGAILLTSKEPQPQTKPRLSSTITGCAASP